MRILFLLILAFSCGHAPVEKNQSLENDEVTLRTAIDQARSSYLLGCVQAYKSMNMPISFPLCRDRAKLHEQELWQIMNQSPLETAPKVP